MKAEIRSDGSLWVEAQNTDEQNALSKLEYKQRTGTLSIVFGMDFNGQELEGPSRIIIGKS